MPRAGDIAMIRIAAIAVATTILAADAAADPRVT